MKRKYVIKSKVGCCHSGKIYQASIIDMVEAKSKTEALDIFCNKSRRYNRDGSAEAVAMSSLSQAEKEWVEGSYYL